MEDRAPVTGNADQDVVVLETRGFGPLLQFHDQVCRSPGRRSDTSEHDVGALAGEGQLVFDEEFDTAPVSIDQVCHQRRDTSLPGPSFSRRGSMADGYHELLAETIRQVRLEH